MIGRGRWSVALTLSGLAIIAVSMTWVHTLSFVMFLGLGVPLVTIGMLLYVLPRRRTG